MARYVEVRIDENNEHHVTRHGVSAREITQVFRNDPAIRRNRRARTGDYIALGVTDGGRQILVIFSYTDGYGVRPIAAWERG
ncbi:MAG: hypothetical protein WCF33_14355 [Pseudonocardiaceae bacterium]